jgi:hypothetical protein
MLSNRRGLAQQDEERGLKGVIDVGPIDEHPPADAELLDRFLADPCGPTVRWMCPSSFRNGDWAMSVPVGVMNSIHHEGVTRVCGTKKVWRRGDAPVRPARVPRLINSPSISVETWKPVEYTYGGLSFFHVV